MAITNPDTLIGSTVVGSDGEKLGKVQDIYYDNATGKPEWAAVKSGMFGGHVSLLPLVNATQHEDGLTAPYSKAQVKEAPHHDPDRELGVDDEAVLFHHYGVPYTGETVTAQPVAAQKAPPARGTAQASSDDAMTRSEEELRVGTRSVETGRARLRKHIVTETVIQSVPVSHDEVHIEREAITDANRDKAMAGPEITEAEHEVVLYADEPVVQKDVVAVERVRLAKETVTGEETVSADVRKEQIEEDTNVADRPVKP